MADDDRSDEVPWHHNSNVVIAAGVAGVVLIAALVVTVVRMSDQWSKPTETIYRTTTWTPDPTTTSRQRQPFVVTPSESTTSFTTSVPLSTTDIGVPPPMETTETSESETSETSTTTTTTTRTTAAEDTDEATTTTRKRPRLNQTRTLFPNGSRD
ncbi:hypothetical protein [[Mycobacterium] wendilense]|uniref:Uncharacterized protein n=1 Tax=[Mycobacterium] wendilense TaxID=3064284 RepID=A0ABM9MIW8_9MYCO|nr:hypothetical protein [Mycolicibacterium sp. MU0050]CAJ1586117.1 hypothetical protein MU0050_004093 [Mycolicibacterium sp. MU0050]